MRDRLARPGAAGDEDRAEFYIFRDGCIRRDAERASILVSAREAQLGIKSNTPSSARVPTLAIPASLSGKRMTSSGAIQGGRGGRTGKKLKV